MKHGKIIDISFPSVAPKTSEDEILSLAEKFVGEIIALAPEAVLCQGEFSLCFAVIQMLIHANIKTVCACSERLTKEFINSDGTVRKESVFSFVKFREYRLVKGDMPWTPSI